MSIPIIVTPPTPTGSVTPTAPVARNISDYYLSPHPRRPTRDGHSGRTYNDIHGHPIGGASTYVYQIPAPVHVPIRSGTSMQQSIANPFMVSQNPLRMPPNPLRVPPVHDGLLAREQSTFESADTRANINYQTVEENRNRIREGFDDGSSDLGLMSDDGSGTGIEENDSAIHSPTSGRLERIHMGNPYLPQSQYVSSYLPYLGRSCSVMSDDSNGSSEDWRPEWLHCKACRPRPVPELRGPNPNYRGSPFNDGF